MKKIYIIFRKILCLIVISTNLVYAAIVSDNDGSAFVTKSEFEALKNGFNSQIETYNTSIDTKIDGAIASYLAGIKTNEIITESIIMSDWEDCTCFNGAVAPTFQLPDFNGTFNYSYNYCYPPAGTTAADGARSYWYDFLITWVGKYTKTWNDSTKCIRPLVTGNSESATDQSANMTWGGVAQQYNESYTVVRAYMDNRSGLTPYLDQPALYSFEYTFRNLTDLILSGYHPNLDTELSAVYSPVSYWVYIRNSDSTRNTTTLATVDSTCFGKTTSTQVDLNSTTNVKKTIYDHIIQWNKSTTWCVSNPNFLKTFRRHSSNSQKSSTLLTAIQRNDANGKETKKFDWYGTNQSWDPATMYALGDRTAGQANVAQIRMQYDANVGVTDTIAGIMPSVGMLSSDQAASKIQQFDTAKQISRKNKTFNVPVATLEKGLPLCIGEYNDVITWNPKFSYVKDYATSTTTQENVSEVNLKFSIGPFTDKDTPTELLQASTNGGSTYSNTVKTTGRSANVTIKMPKDGVVYVKWWPDNATYIDKDWIVTLDLKNCNSFDYYNLDK